MTARIYSTLNELIFKSAKRFPELPAAGFAFERPMAYREFHDKIVSLAIVLQRRGLQKHDRAAILAENSASWGIAYFATIRLGAVVVPILPDFTERDVKHILQDCGAKIIFTTGKQFEKLYDFPERDQKTIIALDDARDPNKIVTVAGFSELLDQGARDIHKPALSEEAAPDDIASIIYTSGTSGHSKAVLLTHKNFCSNLSGAESIFAGLEITGWTFLSILPMSHAYEFTISFLTPLANGARIVYAGKSPTPTILEKICREEHPDVVCMVPMIIEKIYKKKILPALTANRAMRRAVKVPLFRRLISRIIGRKLLAFFGGKLQILALGGAALNIEVERFLREAAMPYLVGYGLTEASPLVSAGPLGDRTIALGSSGKPVRGVAVKIVNPDPLTKIGEIFVSGTNIMRGYRNNPEATAAAIDQDGWLATGDLGYLDQWHNLFIKGRSKNVIVLSHGENIYPEGIEEKINACRYAIESLVSAADDRLEARVYLDYERIDAETVGKNEEQKRAHIKALLATIKKEVNSRLPLYSQLAVVSERTEPFTKTATQKIKRYLYVA